MMPRWTVIFVKSEKRKYFINTKLPIHTRSSSTAVFSGGCLNITRKDMTVAINVKSIRTGRELSESISGKRPPTTPSVK